jgi:FkbM family methyltransferase
VKIRIKQAAKAWIRSIIKLVSKTKVGQYLEMLLIESSMEQVVQVSHAGISLSFSSPNWVSKWRYETFSSKEPETLKWIDALPTGAIFWDIGANIGLYSIYAAKKSACEVWAFEPSVFNLELLARNIYLNDLGKSICIVPIALSDRLGANQMLMTSTEWGGALSTFGENFGWDGKKIHEVFEFKTIGLSISDAVEKLKIPTPDYIKIDVDGIEHLILKGGLQVLSTVKGVLVEVNDAFNQQSNQCNFLLSNAGLILKEKCQSEIVSGSSSGFQNAYNQIWVRP